MTFYDVFGTCGACWHCLVARAATRCPQRRVYGITTSVEEGVLGGWAERVELKPGVRVLPLPDGVDELDFMGGGCGLPTGFHAVERAGLALGDTVVVQGSGPVGLAAAAFELLALCRPWPRDGDTYRAASLRTCFYTVADGERFVVERRDRAWLVSACSGHGFKFAPTIAQALADALEGKRGAAALASWAAGEEPSGGWRYRGKAGNVWKRLRRAGNLTRHLGFGARSEAFPLPALDGSTPSSALDEGRRESGVRRINPGIQKDAGVQV